MTKFINITAFLAVSVLVAKVSAFEQTSSSAGTKSLHTIVLVAEYRDDAEQREREYRERQADEARHAHDIAERAKDIAQEQRDWRMPAYEHSGW